MIKIKRGIKRYLVLAERKAELEAEKKQIEKEQKTLSIPIVESMGTGCKAFYLMVQTAIRLPTTPLIGKQ